MIDNTILLDSRLGRVRGRSDGSVNTFLGIPYAAPPTGQDRFKAPRPHSKWSGTLEGTHFPNRSMQPIRPSKVKRPIAGDLSEDCLYLNIVTPSLKGELKPVMFWIHGGAFVTGSANEYDGSVLAEQGKVVVVTVNFRCGAFGFLDASGLGKGYENSMSNGVLDLITALRWVQQNIEDYGGDPSNVTIFGESSGGSLVMSLIAAPRADELFHKAIAHSATCVHRKPSDRSENIAKRMGVPASDYLEKLRIMPAQKIVDLDIAFGASVDGNIVTRPTFEAILDRGKNNPPMITGTNLREGTLYTQGEQSDQPHYASFNRGLASEMLRGGDPSNYIHGLKTTYPNASAGQYHEMIWTDMFRCICTEAAASMSAVGGSAWLYRFDLPANIPGFEHLGATHSSEMAFTFNTFANPNTHACITYHDRNDPVVRKLGNSWSQAVARFAHTGDPNGGDLPHWPSYEDNSMPCLILDKDLRIEHDLDRIHRDLWNLCR